MKVYGIFNKIVDDKCQELWDKMSSYQRAKFFSTLKRMARKKPAWMNGTTVDKLASVRNWHNLPEELQGILLTSLTVDGFSVSEVRKSRAKMK